MLSLRPLQFMLNARLNVMRYPTQTIFTLKFVLVAPNIEGGDDIKKLNEEAKKIGGSGTSFASKIRSLFFAAKS